MISYVVLSMQFNTEIYPQASSASQCNSAIEALLMRMGDEIEVFFLFPYNFICTWSTNC